MDFGLKAPSSEPKSWLLCVFSARQAHICRARYSLLCYRPSVRHTSGSVKNGWSKDHATFTTSSL